MKYLGIDPGHQGALCILNTAEKREPLSIRDMPVLDGRVDPYALGALFRAIDCETITVAAVERAQAFPRQGVSSVFKYGMGYGMLLGILAVMGIPIIHVPPSKWTTKLGVGSDKEEHRRRAIETWPAQAKLFARKKDEGRADAALIALWASRAEQLNEGAV